MTHLRIRHLRISGLSGAQPSRSAVASALRGALETLPSITLRDPSRRIAGGQSLASAASSLAATLRGHKEDGT